LRKDNFELFNEHFAHKPYFSEVPRFGVHVAGKVSTILAGYVQFNQLLSMFRLGFDTDLVGAAIDWNDCNAPVSTMTYHEKTHTHLLYALKSLVFTVLEGKHYSLHVEDSLRSKFETDTVFLGLIYKNSVRGYWKIAELLVDFFGSNTANNKNLTLRNSLESNNTLFEKARKWSCRAIFQDWPQAEQWQQACYGRACFYKLQLSLSIIERKIQNIAEYLVKLTYGKFSKSSFDECVVILHTLYVQAAKGRKSHLGEPI